MSDRKMSDRKMSDRKIRDSIFLSFYFPVFSFSCLSFSCPIFFSEVDLARKLQDARRERRGDTAEIVVIDVLHLADVEVCVVEDIERLEPEFEVDALSDAGAFDHAQVEIETAGAGNRRQ